MNLQILEMAYTARVNTISMIKTTVRSGANHIGLFGLRSCSAKPIKVGSPIAAAAKDHPATSFPVLKNIAKASAPAAATSIAAG
jgi:hypothetical protein